MIKHVITRTHAHVTPSLIPLPTWHALLDLHTLTDTPKYRFDPDTQTRIPIMTKEQAEESGTLYWNSYEVKMDDDIRPRAHFDTFGWALVTVFQILSGENWNAVMYDAYRAMGGDQNAWASTLYFVVLNILGAFIVLNLCCALLLNNLSNLNDDEDSPKFPRTDEAASEECMVPD